MLIYLKHATAVTSSPTKPRVISIPPRRTDIEVLYGEQSLVSTSKFQAGVSTFLPETPPESPNSAIGKHQQHLKLAKEWNKEADTDKRARERQAFNRIRSRTTWSTSPPSSGEATGSNSQTIRRNAALQSVVLPAPTLSRPVTPPPFAVHVNLKLSELTTWIVVELETATVNEACQPLQLDSSVIQQLRLPPKQRKIPRQAPLVPARSSFAANRGPLSSHTSPSAFACSPTEKSEWPSLTTRTSVSNSDSSLSILDRIFPLATRPNTSHLLATIIAHEFVCALHVPLQQTTAVTTNISPFAADPVSKRFARVDAAPPLLVCQSAFRPRRVLCLGFRLVARRRKRGRADRHCPVFGAKLRGWNGGTG